MRHITPNEKNRFKQSMSVSIML